MIGIGPFEIFVILVVLLIVVGPERMPEIVRFLARILREVRSAAAEMRDQVEHMAEVDEIRDELRKDTAEIRKSVEDSVPDELRLIGPAEPERSEPEPPSRPPKPPAEEEDDAADAAPAEADAAQEQAVNRE